jgi:hypothetical protein
MECAMDEFNKAMWFSNAVFIVVFGNLAFYLYLREAGVRVSFTWAGTPGYLDYVYYTWRRDQNRSSFLVILLRILSLANALAATYFTFFRFR